MDDLSMRGADFGFLQGYPYPDGQAVAIYGQYPPLVSALSPSGQCKLTTCIPRAAI